MRSLLIILLLFNVNSVLGDVSWFSRPSHELMNHEWEEVSYCAPADDIGSSYIKLLQNHEYLKITAKEVYELCDRKLWFDDKYTPYLVRGLYIGKYTGMYYVKKYKTMIWINHESLAGPDTPITKTVLIVFLKENPEKVYVTAYADR